MIVYVKTQNKGTLNLRQSTSTASKILAQIPYGAKLEVEKVNESWSQVTYSGHTGYVMTKYLEEVTPTTDRAKLQAIYDSLKATLKLIEDALK